jgi:sugar phosphate isomerase/epimerase
MARYGFSCTELCFVQNDFNYWVYNGQGKIDNLTSAEVKTIADTYRRKGIEVSALGVFTNLLEPDDAALESNIEYFKKHMEFAAYCGIRYVSTECGFIPGNRGIQAHTYESAFERLKCSIKKLAKAAEEYDVYIAVEPCVLDVIPSAKRMRDFIYQTDTERVKVLLDPANLIANSSEEDMFKYLSPHIAYFHGKDRKVNDTYGRLVGDGDIDWPLFMSYYHKYNDNAPFILEYANSQNCGVTLERLLEYDRIALEKYK